MWVTKAQTSADQRLCYSLPWDPTWLHARHKCADLPSNQYVCWTYTSYSRSRNSPACSLHIYWYSVHLSSLLPFYKICMIFQLSSAYSTYQAVQNNYFSPFFGVKLIMPPTWKPDFVAYEPQRNRSACASAQSNQCLCYSLPGNPTLWFASHNLRQNQSDQRF